MSRFLPSVLGVMLAALFWTLAAKAAGPLLLPSPSAVIGSLIQDHERLFVAVQQTTLAALAGLSIAALVGLATATASFSSRTVGALLSPWLLALQVVPIVAIAPLLVVWLGYGLPVAVTTAFIASIFPVHSAGRSGLLAASQDQVDLLRLYGASSLQILLQLRLRLALPGLFAGFRVAAGLAVIGAIIGEFVGSNGVPPTLGQLVVYSARSARTDLCFAAIVCAGLLAACLQAAIAALERAMIGRWYGK
jgi:NitT/TauT family transport system permease protein